MTRYVAGFLFNTIARTAGLSAPDAKAVFVLKNRPAWQAGKFNAVGGHIEQGETPAEAMSREFLEEAGHFRDDWEQFCVLKGADFEVHFFRAFDDDLEVSTMTDETIAVMALRRIMAGNSMPNLQWLIQMALSMDRDSASEFVVTEVKAA